MNLIESIESLLHNVQKIKEMSAGGKLNSEKDIQNAMKYIDKIMFILQEIKQNESTIIYVVSIVSKMFMFFKRKKK